MSGSVRNWMVLSVSLGVSLLTACTISSNAFRERDGDRVILLDVGPAPVPGCR